MRTTPAVGPAFWSPLQAWSAVAGSRERADAQDLEIHVADVQRGVGLRAQALGIRSALARAPARHAGAEGIALRVVARLGASRAAVAVAADAEVALGPLSRRGGMCGTQGDHGGGNGGFHRTAGRARRMPSFSAAAEGPRSV